MYDSSTSVAPSDAGPMDRKDVPAPTPSSLKTAPGKPVPTSIHTGSQAAEADRGGAEGSKTGVRNVIGHQILFLRIITDMQLKFFDHL